MEIADAFDVIAALGLNPISAPARRDIRLASDDRFDTLLLCLQEKLDRAEHVAMIGNRDRGHPRRLDVSEKRSDFVGAIQQAVLGMNVQMYETHRGFTRLRPAGNEDRKRALQKDFPITSPLTAAASD